MIRKHRSGHDTYDTPPDEHSMPKGRGPTIPRTGKSSIRQKDTATVRSLAREWLVAHDVPIPDTAQTGRYCPEMVDLGHDRGRSGRLQQSTDMVDVAAVLVLRRETRIPILRRDPSAAGPGRRRADKAERV